MPVKLSDNALTTLKNRYFLRDSEGETIEDAERLWKRIASAVASAEPTEGTRGYWEFEFHNLLESLDFLPNTPTIMNAGKENGQLSACFTEEVKIETVDGPKPISEISVGDKVLTHKGRYRKVIDVMKRSSNDVYELKIDKLPTMRVTGEHPFLTDEGLKTLSNLSIREDYVRIGRLPQKEKAAYIEVEGVEYDEYEGVEYDEYIYQKLSESYHYGRTAVLSKGVNRVKSRVTIDEDVAWLLGMYLAEGSICPGNDIRFTLSLDEEDYAETIETLLKEKLGLDSKIRQVKRDSSWLEVRTHSKLLAAWLEQNFGKGFAGKKLPSWANELPMREKTALLQGVADGDGYKVNIHQTKITLVNEDLIRQLFFIAKDLGFEPSLNRGSKTRLSSDYPWSITYGQYWNKGMVRDGAYRVRQIDKVDGNHDVYNFEVEEDHTYVANQIVVHNCFVLPIEDKLAGGGDTIFGTLDHMALIHQTGGGTGFDFSRLRPEGSMVSSKLGVSTGPLSFCKIYDAATESVKQGASRRGANMMTLRVDHPDILEFIDMKMTPGVMTNFNVSVTVTDEFMEALENDGTYRLYHEFTGSAGELRAREVWDKIANNAHRSAEPGLIFIDRVNSRSPYWEPIEATNPCGEQPLPAYGSCNLGSINLSNFVKDGEVDWERLGQVTCTAARFLDNVIDVNSYPIPEIEEHTKRYRNIGLGVMGWADMLIKLKIPYNSQEAVELGEKVMEFINKNGHKYSVELGREKGVPSGAPFKDVGLGYTNQHRRNATVTTVAPTGTLCIIAGCSSGIEPNFAFEYEKHVMDTILTEYHPLYEKAKNNGGVNKDVFVDAHRVDPITHVDMQAAFQKHCDSGISKTINLHSEATVQDVKDAYLRAWKSGCKGITVYRDGSRGIGVLHRKDEPKTVEDCYCIECGGELTRESGCETCLTCGWSKCTIA